MVQPKKLPAFFFQTPAGNEPVREWLRALDEADRRVIGLDIAIAEFAWPVGMPVCRALGRGLHEIRSDIGRGRTARVIFCVAAQRMVLLHGFVKKTRKTPQRELELARRRMKELLE